ncbi:MarR family winged helix-turn-helix transcriptional regulator [Paraburkholderia sp.]|uniref:MarR family winged helix-turn-helix transcriptional regulator n=1 Tax=Paraburkholderia sp. TaxID=1926495 RepID=UPI0034398E58
MHAEDDCFAIRQAARYVSQLYDRHLGRVGITTTQFSIMYKLQRGVSMTMRQLADAMVMDRTTLVRAIQPLQRDGFIAMDDRAAPDCKARTLKLTDAGLTKLDHAHDHWHAAQRDFEQQFGAERAASLRRELFAMTHYPVRNQTAPTAPHTHDSEDNAQPQSA